MSTSSYVMFPPGKLSTVFYGICMPFKGPYKAEQGRHNKIFTTSQSALVLKVIMEGGGVAILPQRGNTKVILTAYFRTGT